MRKLLLMACLCFLLGSCSNEKKEESKTDGTSTESGNGDKKKAATELLDMSEAASARASIDAFARGDVDAMVANYSDSVFHLRSGGDSLVGKQAVKDYYKGRWNLIQSLKFSNHIILPIKVNESQAPPYDQPGKWVLHWYMTDVTYKNGKALNFWIHNANHYNADGKVDFIGQYIDMHPLIEATKDLMK